MGRAFRNSEDDDDDVSVSSSNSGSSTTKEDRGDSTADLSNNSWEEDECRSVLRSRRLVLFVIVLATMACATATYFFVERTEQETFRLQFHGFATEITDFSQQEAVNMFNTMESLSTTITGIAMATNSNFPLVTIPRFDVHGVASNNITIVEQVSFAPLIKRSERLLWEGYARENQGWMNESLASVNGTGVAKVIPPKIHEFDNSTSGYGPWAHAPIWQQAPISADDLSAINFDLLSHPTFTSVFHGMKESQKPVLTEPLAFDFLAVHHGVDHNHPHSLIVGPVFPTFGVHSHDDIVGILVAVLPWDRYFTNILHSDLAEQTSPVTVVLHNSCGEHFSYTVEGPDATFLGSGDQHDPRYRHMKKTVPFAKMLKQDYLESSNYCEYDLNVFPTRAMEDQYITHKPYLYAAIVVLVFGVMAVSFLIFDYTVARRQDDVLAKATRTNAIVSSLFPSNVRDRILHDAEQQLQREMGDEKGAKNPTQGDGKDKGPIQFHSKPIADLFPETTIMFADIVGFTAWSSAREPYQVFILLETLYQAFDEIAKRRRVFKVETIGDCYVAVAGLPDPRPDHAVVMARFAQDCKDKMNILTRQLETTLGPDTADLSMRIGLHSGQVTAGVLRGEKGRFQLFGDTMNTAARMESNGARNRIHCSQETAALLQEAGKAWTIAREDLVHAKGKGALQTFWIEMQKKPSQSNRTGSTSSGDDGVDNPTDLDDEKWLDSSLAPKEAEVKAKEVYFPLSDKEQRLVDWNTDVLCRLLKQIVARNQAAEKNGSTSIRRQASICPIGITTVIDEVVETIELPELDVNAHTAMASYEQIELDPTVVEQVRDYISTVATMYPKNSFHNFEHASHVTMSVSKLLSRIVAPTEGFLSKKKGHDNDVTDPNMVTLLHDHTYGITSDPLTQFACVFSALIHDVDHSGVPNHQLVKEKAPIAMIYDGRSVAEQNSIDLAWTLLMDSSYSDFRDVLFAAPKAMARFRQLVINSVIATDIMDADLKCLRNMRWAKAFQASNAVVAAGEPATREQVNRKATIVLEHLIQASDIAHTMQHWHIYRKWNERLFEEMYTAYQKGRADKNPAENWYQGEIGFFDFYIIPLARKLKDCGVFGVSSDEYLSYAIKNRGEWELRGQEIVADMVEKFKAAHPTLVLKSSVEEGENQSLEEQNDASPDPDELFQQMLESA